MQAVVESSFFILYIALEKLRERDFGDGRHTLVEQKTPGQ
jgi:hypothetical protein